MSSKAEPDDGDDFDIPSAHDLFRPGVFEAMYGPPTPAPYDGDPGTPEY